MTMFRIFVLVWMLAGLSGAAAQSQEQLFPEPGYYKDPVGSTYSNCIARVEYTPDRSDIWITLEQDPEARYRCSVLQASITLRCGASPGKFESHLHSKVEFAFFAKTGELHCAGPVIYGGVYGVFTDHGYVEPNVAEAYGFEKYSFHLDRPHNRFVFRRPLD